MKKNILKELIKQVLHETERVCSFCNTSMGERPGTGVTHGVCPKCHDSILNSYIKDKEKSDKKNVSPEISK